MGLRSFCLFALGPHGGYHGVPGPHGEYPGAPGLDDGRPCAGGALFAPILGPGGDHLADTSVHSGCV